MESEGRAPAEENTKEILVSVNEKKTETKIIQTCPPALVEWGVPKKALQVIHVLPG